MVDTLEVFSLVKTKRNVHEKVLTFSLLSKITLCSFLWKIY